MSNSTRARAPCRSVAACSALGVAVALYLHGVAGAAPPKRASAPSAPASARPAAAAPTASPAPAPATKTLAELLSGDAKVDYEVGKVLFADGDFAGAAARFQRAYDASKEPRLLWNMAACEKSAKRYTKAAALLERYRAEAGAALTVSDTQEIGEAVAALSAMSSTLVVTTNEPAATVLIDDEAVGTAPLAQPLRVDVGTHRVRVTKDGFHPASVVVEVSASSPSSVDVPIVRDLHEGRMAVSASPGDMIAVDDQVVGTGAWEGALSRGVHALHVKAPGKVPVLREVVIDEGQTRALTITLEAEPAPPPRGIRATTWLLLVGGGAALAGGALTAVVLLNQSDAPSAAQPVVGTMRPGTVQLPLQR